MLKLREYHCDLKEKDAAAMKQFEVQWRFASGYELARTSIVLARDQQHAEEKVWLLHVEHSQLRKEIEFISVQEV